MVWERFGVNFMRRWSAVDEQQEQARFLSYNPGSAR